MDAIKNQLKSINCTECSAPLDLHGGRQVKSISCPYCGAVLDNKNEYKVLRHFSLKDRPKTRLKIGQQGVLKDVKFTIIGLIEYKTKDDDSWIEYQLFSPTHGYSWLTQEESHFVFGHKVRYYPETYSKERKSEFIVNDKTYQVISDYKAHISFVEGELTWIARKNDKVEALDAIAPPYIYSIEKTKHEQEYSLGEYMTAETICKAFNITEGLEKADWIHAAQPNNSVFFSPLMKINAVFAILFTLVWILLKLATPIFEEPNTLLSVKIPAVHYEDTFISKPFTVRNPYAYRLLRIDLNLKELNNNWVFFDIKIKKDNHTVHSVTKEIYYYQANAVTEKGQKGKGYEGENSASLYFNIPSKGNYQLFIRGKGGEKLPPLSVHIKQNTDLADTLDIVNTRHISLLWFAAIFGLVVPWMFFGQIPWGFERKRWSDNA